MLEFKILKKDYLLEALKVLFKNLIKKKINNLKLI